MNGEGAGTNDKPVMESDWLTVTEIVETMGLHRNTVYRWVQQGLLPGTIKPSVQAGLRIDRREFEDLMARRRVAASLTAALTGPQ